MMEQPILQISGNNHSDECGGKALESIYFAYEQTTFRLPTDCSSNMVPLGIKITPSPFSVVLQ
jgi:hypothetical protein